MKHRLEKLLPNSKIKEEDITLPDLPLFLKNSYKFVTLDIDNMSFLGVEVKDSDLGPRQVKKHSQLFFNITNQEQIYHFKSLHHHKIQRMIQNRFNFIVDDKIVHLPDLALIIKNQKIVENLKSKNEVKGLTANILIYQILTGKLSSLNKAEISNIFDMTPMSITRSIKELLQYDLCEEQKVSVSKFISFKDKKVLWKFSKNNLSSPIKRTHYIKDQPIKNLPFSGISALAKLSNIQKDKFKVLASYKDGLEKEIPKEHFTTEEFSSIKLEIWNRKPLLVKKNCINPIDLYLCLKNNTDERVQLALDYHLKKHDLEI